jgi:hypothetical protein
MRLLISLRGVSDFLYVVVFIMLVEGTSHTLIEYLARQPTWLCSHSLNNKQTINSNSGSIPRKTIRSSPSSRRRTQLRCLTPYANHIVIP